MKADNERKKLIIKMITSVIIVIAGLFQKQVENEDLKRTDDDEYMF